MECPAKLIEIPNWLICFIYMIIRSKKTCEACTGQFLHFQWHEKNAKNYLKTSKDGGGSLFTFGVNRQMFYSPAKSFWFLKGTICSSLLKIYFLFGLFKFLLWSYIVIHTFHFSNTLTCTNFNFPCVLLRTNNSTISIYVILFLCIEIYSKFNSTGRAFLF